MNVSYVFAFIKAKRKTICNINCSFTPDCHLVSLSSPSSHHQDHLPGPHLSKEIFFPIYQIWVITHVLCLEVEKKMMRRIEGNIDGVTDGNPSTEGPKGEANESTVITGDDSVINHHLQEASFTKEAHRKHIKGNMKSNKVKYEEQSQQEQSLSYFSYAHQDTTNGTDGVLSYSFIFTLI